MWIRIESPRGDYSWLTRCYFSSKRFKVTEDPDNAYEFSDLRDANGALESFGSLPEQFKIRVVTEKDEE